MIDLEGKKVLKLTLKKEPFDVMVTGEKSTEYRHPSDWIVSRLMEKKGGFKKYDFVLFTNGYGSDKPYFIAEYLETYQNVIRKSYEYSNGMTVDVQIGDLAVCLGRIMGKGNLKP